MGLKRRAIALVIVKGVSLGVGEGHWAAGECRPLAVMDVVPVLVGAWEPGGVWAGVAGRVVSPGKAVVVGLVMEGVTPPPGLWVDR
jgi:hypothetical protein